MKYAIFIVLGILLVIQVIRPDFTNPKVNPQEELHASVPVMKVLKSSCYDCHSNETKYPWYSNIAPVSWFMADHINRGRKALNFSNWAMIDPKVKLSRLKRVNHLIKRDLMPISNYTWMHKNAILKPKQKKLLEEFFDKQIQKLKKS
ncbi:heme-binding domain-containing protein [Sulfurospirillum sp. 1612]|uniref:heme-binding domain-containing protein n=1 Tax=Sulfurospirillum sp. 1612 TaxID=3094835 RepID=UPI002F92DE5C